MIVFDCSLLNVESYREYSHCHGIVTSAMSCKLHVTLIHNNPFATKACSCISRPWSMKKVGSKSDVCLLQKKRKTGDTSKVGLLRCPPSLCTAIGVKKNKSQRGGGHPWGAMIALQARPASLWVHAPAGHCKILRAGFVHFGLSWNASYTKESENSTIQTREVVKQLQFHEKNLENTQPQRNTEKMMCRNCSAVARCHSDQERRLNQKPPDFLIFHFLWCEMCNFRQTPTVLDFYVWEKTRMLWNILWHLSASTVRRGNLEGVICLFFISFESYSISIWYVISICENKTTPSPPQRTLLSRVQQVRFVSVKAERP